MGRGKTPNKTIENPTNRQVTFSKRRKGLFKKADELTILCDAKVSIIIVSSSSGKLIEYISHSTTTKEMFDRYQKTLGVDLWKNKYEKMQEELRLLKEKNNRLRREVRQRKGEDLSDLNFSELCRLELEMDSYYKITRSQHHKKIKSKSSTLRKKTKDFFSNPSSYLVEDAEPKSEDVYGNVDNGVQYESAGSHFYAFGMHHPNLYYAPVVEPHQFRLV